MRINAVVRHWRLAELVPGQAREHLTAAQAIEVQLAALG
jgi:hypothetical protein